MAQTLLTPRYYQQFQCIGDRCEDNCCHGWTISIDKQTYRHYVSHPDRLIQSTAKQHIQKVKKSDAHWGTIRMDEQGACPFLDNIGLCNVHKQAGAAALSHTCKSYPRLQQQFGDQHRRSLVLSCPEVSRLVLLDPQAMAMEATDFTGKGKPLAVPPALAALHMMSIDVLLSDGMTMEERLWLIGMLVHRDEARGSNQAFLEQMQPMIAQGQLGTAFAQLPFIGRLQWWALRTLTHLLTLNSQNQHRRGRATMGRCLDSINRLLAGEYDEERLARLHLCWHERVAPFLAERPHIQQNHLLYYVYHNQFPASEQSPQRAYRLLIADYFLLRSYLCLLAMEGDPLTERDVTDLYYSYHTARQHNKSFLTALEQGLDNSGFASDISLYALLKTGAQ